MQGRETPLYIQAMHTLQDMDLKRASMACRSSHATCCMLQVDVRCSQDQAQEAIAALESTLSTEGTNDC